MTAFVNILRRKKVLIFLGAGGVGKTTSSLACAMAAAQEGRRVALLSIDPAKRLAAALGIALDGQLRQVNVPVSGSLFAAMLDQKAVFDAMVRKHSPSDAVTEKIMRDPLYKAASTNLSGPLEYMALAKLHELVDSRAYDLVIIDTPPDHNALDFLARPNVLAGFLEGRVMNWLIKPFLFAAKSGLGKLLSSGEKIMGGVASVTGVNALRSFGEFLVLMNEVIIGFHRAGESVLAILREETTGFVLVMVPTSAAARSARNLTNHLAKLKYQLDALIVNRCTPKPSSPLSPMEGLVPKNEAELLCKRWQGQEQIMVEMRRHVNESASFSGLFVDIFETRQHIHSVTAMAEFAQQFRRE